MAAPMVAKTPDKPAKFQSTFCAMHIVSSTKSSFISVDSNSWKRFAYFANKWKNTAAKKKKKEVTLETELGLTSVDDVQCPNT